jgi:hypothetical protein
LVEQCLLRVQLLKKNEIYYLQDANFTEMKHIKWKTKNTCPTEQF